MLNMKDLTKEEVIEYLGKLYDRLLEHRYRYYVLDDPALSDFVYDYMEKEYNRLAQEHGVKLMDMVDFDPDDPLAAEAKNRVDSETDYHSMWEKSMFFVWSRLGRARKDRDKE